MDNTKFKAFIECINKGSVTAAAEELGYTPSAVSQLISSLEKELGLKLLNRTQRGVSLTSEGSELVPAIRAWLAAEDEVYQLAADLKGISTGTLTIASYPSAAITWLPRIIRCFKNDYPGIDINIVENIRSDIFEHLEKNEADMAILVYSEPMPYEWISLADVEMLAAVPEDNPYANAEAFPIKEIENYDFIMANLPEEWKSTDAYKDGKIYMVCGSAADLMQRPSTRLAQATELVGRIFHEDSFPDKITIPKFFGNEYTNYLTYSKTL